MNRTLVKHALASNGPMEHILIQGWVRTRRDAKAFSFVEVNEGTSLKSIQVIVDASLEDYRNIAEVTTGASVSIQGKLVASQG